MVSLREVDEIGVHMASGRNEVAAKKMSTRLKAKDVPEPWQAPKKAKSTASQTKTAQSEFTVQEDSSMHTAVDEVPRRGRGRPKGKSNATTVSKRKVKANSFTTSTADVVFGRSKSSVPDVNELRQKREEDALACGRQVRSVKDASKFTPSPPPVTDGATHGQKKKGIASTVDSDSYDSRQLSSKIQVGAEYEMEVEDDAIHVVEEQFHEPVAAHRPGKEPILEELKEAWLVKRKSQEKVRSARQALENDNVRDPEGAFHREAVAYSRRSVSPPKGALHDRYKGREGVRTEATEDGFPSQSMGSKRSSCRSPLKNWPQSSRMEERWSPRRSPCRSPSRWSKDCQHWSDRNLAHDDDDFACTDRLGHDYRKSSQRFSSTDHRRSERNDASSPKSDRLRRRSPFLLENQRPSRRSFNPISSRSQRRMSGDFHDGKQRQWLAFTCAKEEVMAGTSSASARKKRREEQGIREEDMANRQRDGRKPFYLTVDAEGKPYGLGKPAWVAEINKLAAGLDPSCTHIRKQTYEDVQTFKDRLNEHFEYSGTLNEDYLRGLMGKAVTKRRGELISLIKNNEEQPLNIDRQIWRRLEKLASSKQREEKSEQGRYANACRKTLGRTGAGGVNGVRERLRAQLRRSPDPDEMEEELQRDKGFGGQQRRKLSLSCERKENNMEVVVVDEDLRSQPLGRSSVRCSADTSSAEQYKREQSQGIGRSIEYGVDDEDGSTARSGSAERTYHSVNDDGFSKDEYIQSLKAEIEQLQSGKVRASTSNTCLPPETAVSTVYKVREEGKRASREY